MVNRFLSTYKDGHEVYLSDKERDEIAEEIERLHTIIKEVREYIENHSITNMEWWITGEQKIECKFMKDANPQELLKMLGGVIENE